MDGGLSESKNKDEKRPGLIIWGTVSSSSTTWNGFSGSEDQVMGKVDAEGNVLGFPC